MTIFTIGFTKKSAEEFFETLIRNGVKRVIDIRLNNKSQLAGFAKNNDLKYFLKKIAEIDYVHKPEYAPSEDLLKGYRLKDVSWEEYEKEYPKILENRKILDNIDLSMFDNGVLLCSEEIAENCHRRLFAEYLAANNKNVEIVHL